MRAKRTTLLLLNVALTLALMACRGQTSTSPPIHPNPNMDNQFKYDPQEVNKLFSDKRATREPVPGTVARGTLHEDQGYYQGKNPDGSYLWSNPRMAEPSSRAALLRRGQERYNIYCSPCHARTGDGQGIVMPPRYIGMVPPPSFMEERIRLMPDGEIFNTITHGIRTMPSYRHQVDPDDRWAIIAYIRALQRSQHTTLADIPADQRASLGVNP